MHAQGKGFNWSLVIPWTALEVLDHGAMVWVMGQGTEDLLQQLCPSASEIIKLTSRIEYFECTALHCTALHGIAFAALHSTSTSSMYCILPSPHFIWTESSVYSVPSGRAPPNWRLPGSYQGTEYRSGHFLCWLARANWCGSRKTVCRSFLPVCWRIYRYRILIFPSHPKTFSTLKSSNPTFFSVPSYYRR